MLSTTDVSAPQTRTWQWYVGLSIALLVFAAVLVGAWMLYTGVTASLQAEEDLHATLFTIRLVEQFVHENGRWPQSWSDLEQLAFPSDAPSPLNGDLAVIRIGVPHRLQLRVLSMTTVRISRMGESNTTKANVEFSGRG